jgi:hypothetical protein
MKRIVVTAFAIVALCAFNSAHAGLVSEWLANGNGFDAVGSNNGALQNATYGPGISGQAFLFSGLSGSSFVVPTSPSLQFTNSFTFAAWVNTTSLTGHQSGGQGIISMVGGQGGDYGYQFGLVDTSSSLAPVFLAFSTSGYHPGGSSWGVGAGTIGEVPTNVWTFIAATYDGNAASIYVNGPLAASQSVGPGPLFYNGANFRISGDDNGNVPFQGSIDQIMVFNNALSAGQIEALYSSAAVPVPGALLLFAPGLVGLGAMRRRFKK